MACQDLHGKLEVCNTKLIDEVKREVNTTRHFDQIAQLLGAQKQNLIPNSLAPRLPKEPDGILLIKRKTDGNKVYDKNKILILCNVKGKNSGLRVRGMSKLYGGGVKIATAAEVESKLFKEHFRV
ncbi:hypothetical protein AVEN_100279-1 [Araneus ventricosus]|uniref:Uncharacterized protein n=1 Tax=Araneus ventricosus TaxID=182803 RepID=A0A4Y2UA59_ARAVE|nr:hypothetical protein AVEN_100279-1 [Araneus ventricosus]